MVSKELTIINRDGFHMRAAMQFAETMKKYSAEVTIVHREARINGKSIIGIMSEGIPCGDRICVLISGEDEKKALSEAEELINGGFGEKALILCGVGASQGCGVGKAVIIEDAYPDYSAVKYSSSAEEKARLKKAVEGFIAETKEMCERLKKSAGEKEAEILEGHLSMLSDPTMLSKMNDRIDSGAVAEASVDFVCSGICKTLEAVDGEIMRQRAADVKDIRDSLIRALTGTGKVDIASVEKGSVLIARSFAPSDISRIKRENISAIITETGGVTSHSAVLARAMGIPAVFSVKYATDIISGGDTVIADGFDGRVITNPDEAQTEEYKSRQKAYIKEKEGLKIYLNKPSVTMSGEVKRVLGNIEKPEETSDVILNGGEGIGLYRTEFLFMNRNCAPTEKEQFEAYSAVAKMMDKKEVIIRTLDLGGDKSAPYLRGFDRGVRGCLSDTELFKIQIRAILRAAYDTNVKILIPFVTSVNEVREVKRLVGQCAAELEQEETPYKKTPLGVMIETPSAVLISDILAKEADFFSIGTNDLTEYMLASDREKAVSLFGTFQLSVLRAIEITVKNAKARGITVGICGEAAADARLAEEFIKWGIDEFSVSPPYILKTRKAICRCSGLNR